MSDQPRYQPVEALTEPIKIVVIAAHHDDIEFGVSGSVAKWIDEGADVTYVIITNGGAGSNDPDTDIAALIATRREEQLAAAAVVGVTDVRFLDYQDGVLQPTLDLRRDLTRILREVKPYRVVCQDPTTVLFQDSYINHPDHRAAGEAAIYAVFPSCESRPIFPELLDEGYEPHKITELYLNLSLNPTHYMDITDTIERKIESLKTHVSQIGEPEKAEEGALKFIRERNAESGERVGVDYAEFFRVMILRRADEINEDKEVPEKETAD